MSRPLLVPAPTPEPPVEPTPLAALRPGDRAVVLDVDTSSPLGRRLLDLGFRPGTPVVVGRHAPLGDPTTYELRGSRFCLRQSEARRIMVARDDAVPPAPGDAARR